MITATTPNAPEVKEFKLEGVKQSLIEMLELKGVTASKLSQSCSTAGQHTAHVQGEIRSDTMRTCPELYEREFGGVAAKFMIEQYPHFKKFTVRTLEANFLDNAEGPWFLTVIITYDAA